MLKRRAKRNTKKIFITILTIVASVVILIALFFAFKMLIPVFRGVNAGGEVKILKPNGTSTSVDDLNKQLQEKGVVFESLNEASVSGVIIGKISDGPTVHFSKEQDASWQVISLKLIIQRLRMDNKKPTLVDLSGAKPIVKF